MNEKHLPPRGHTGDPQAARGHPGSNQETPRRHPPRRHSGGTQQAPRATQKAPRGTKEAARGPERSSS